MDLARYYSEFVDRAEDGYTTLPLTTASPPDVPPEIDPEYLSDFYMMEREATRDKED